MGGSTGTGVGVREGGREGPGRGREFDPLRGKGKYGSVGCCCCSSEGNI